MIIQALLHTPLWVYGLLLILLYFGAKNCRKTTPLIKTLIVLPVTLSIWSLIYFFTKVPLEFKTIGTWILGASLGAIFGWIMVRRHKVVVDKEKRRLQLPGSPIILIMILFFFSFRYYVGITIAMYPEQLHNASFIVLMLGISGLVMGIFIGRTTNYLYRLKVGPYC